jgi:hypothetical protein
MFFPEALNEFIGKTPLEEKVCKNLTLKIDEKFRCEVIRYLGYKNNAEVPTQIDSLIQRGMDEVCDVAESRAIYRCFSIQNSENFLLREDGYKTSHENSGEICSLLLHQCDGIILMAATLGIPIDRLLNRTQIRDITYALVLDSCATAAIESVCDDLQYNLTAIYIGQNMYLTNRYSPGYGNLPLSFQTKLLSSLDAERKIGLNMTSNFLLTPTKSVTAIIGISKSQQKIKRISCNICKMRQVCHFRRSKVL